MHSIRPVSPFQWQPHAMSFVRSSSDDAREPSRAGCGRLRGDLLLYRKTLAKRLNADGPLSPATIEQVARDLATRLPPAL